MADNKDLNLEEKLRKLIGDKKKEKKKIEIKKEEKKPEEKVKLEEKESARENFEAPFETPVIRLDNSISLGPKLDASNVQRIQRQNLESNVWESAPTFTATNTNEQLKTEEKYQNAREMYETGERIRQPTLNDPQRATRIGDWNVVPTQSGMIGRTLNVIDPMQNRMMHGDVEKYDAIKEDTQEKSNWRISNKDTMRKYGVNE